MLVILVFIILHSSAFALVGSTVIETLNASGSRTMVGPIASLLTGVPALTDADYKAIRTTTSLVSGSTAYTMTDNTLWQPGGTPACTRPVHLVEVFCNGNATPVSYTMPSHLPFGSLVDVYAIELSASTCGTPQLNSGSFNSLASGTSYYISGSVTLRYYSNAAVPSAPTPVTNVVYTFYPLASCEALSALIDSRLITLS